MRWTGGKTKNLSAFLILDGDKILDKKVLYGAAQEIKIKIMDMINAGKNSTEILLEVAKMLGELSGEETFYREVHEQFLAVQGFALDEKFILEKELQEVSARLEKIQAAEKNDDFTEEEHKRMGYAIERHKAEIERLKKFAE